MENSSPSFLLFSLTSIKQHYAELLLALFSLFLLHRLFKLHILPLNLPFVGALPYVIVNSTHLHDWSTDLLRRNKLTCIMKGLSGTPGDFLLTCDPANVLHVFTSNFTNYPKGKEFSKIFDVLGDGIFNADSDSWAFQRRKAHSLMADMRFRTYTNESTNNKLENYFLPLLEEMTRSGRVVDLQDLFLRLTFDLTAIFIFGFDPGCLVPGLPVVPFAKAMDDAEEILFYRHIAPIQWLRLEKKYNFGSYKRMGKAWKVIDQTIADYVLRKREMDHSMNGSETSEPKFDLLSSYMNCQSEVGKEGEDFNKFLRDTTFNLMVAGRDTTSSGLAWFFYLLHKNPHIEEKILQEIMLHVADDSGFATAVELKKLAYLHAALSESLRLYPPVPFEHKTALKPDILPNGVPVDSTRRIQFSLYAMGRMEEIWGKDCMEFKPERWLSDTGKLRYEPSYKFMAFNSGPRTCLGRDLAFMQMKAVVVAIMKRYRFEVVPGFVVRPKFSIILHMQDGLKVRVRPRA